MEYAPVEGFTAMSEPATTRWVRAAGADIARFDEAGPLGCQYSACPRNSYGTTNKSAR
jgi:hypothetical protein